VDEHTWALTVQQQDNDSDSEDFHYSIDDCFQQLSVESDEGEINMQTNKKCAHSQLANQLTMTQIYFQGNMMPTFRKLATCCLSSWNP
jgi:hypothetical protein